MWPGLVHPPLPGKKRHVEVRMLKAVKMVLDTCIQAALLPRNGEFSNVSVLEVIPAMEAQTSNSALVTSLDSLTAKVHKLKGGKKKNIPKYPSLIYEETGGEGREEALI